MKRKGILRLLALLACLALALAASAAAETAVPAETVAPAEAAPVDAIRQFGEYTALDLEPYRGKAIYLNFLTEWCPYCMEELPDIKRVFDEYSPDELQIVLVHVWDGEDGEATERIKAQYGLEDMTFFEDTDGAVSRFVGLGGYPASIFLGKDGAYYTGFNYATDYNELAGYMDAMGVSKK